eukprot:TRINITY_DN11106_c0_g1_i26.p5 TRINITY_DN11106_c0_g1~~TRINITY_DN11106_c0_g1_i26.p5  ORF type:complete len:147 (+),score=33.25 TRINITY_DN11106_c0_g1_i26:1326-1766(+)
MVPLVGNLIRNSSAEIRLALLKNFEELRKVVGSDEVAEHLAETIRQLVADKRWRIRMNIVDYAPIMARVLGPKAFQEQFGELYLSCLNDSVFAVREVTIKNIKELVLILGPEWTEKYAMPKLMSYQTHSNYPVSYTHLTLPTICSV